MTFLLKLSFANDTVVLDEERVGVLDAASSIARLRPERDLIMDSVDKARLLTDTGGELFFSK